MHKKMNDLSESLMNMAFVLNNCQRTGNPVEGQLVDDLAKASGKLLAWSKSLENKEMVKGDI